MASEVGGVFIDLTEIYEHADGQVFTDYAHLTPLGNRITARAIAERIVPLIRPPVAAARSPSPDSGPRD